MKLSAKKRFISLLILPLSVLLGFGARLLCLHALSALFKAWNLTETTFSYAPLYAQRLAELSGNIADVCFLVFFTLPLFVYAGSFRVHFGKRHFVFPAAGILLSVLTVGVFLLAGSARMPKIRVYPIFTAALLYALSDVLSVTACAYLARKTPSKMFPSFRSFRFILSAVLTAVFWMAAKNSLSPILILNACISGVLLFILFEKTKSVLPEILFLFTFRLFTRFVFGFPDLGGAYPVSEPLLTGAMNGVSHSVLLSIYLFIVLMCHFFHAKKRRKGESNVSP